MLKNKFKIITMLLIIMMTLSITIPVVRAENETNNAQATNPVIDDPEADDHQQTNTGATENATNSNTTSPEGTANQTPAEGTENAGSQETTSEEDGFKKSDIYLSGDNVTIDYIVDGNLFVFANSVTIKSQIGGDAFIIAKSITVESEGYIYSNLFAMADSIDIKGAVCDVYAAADNINVSGYIYRDMKAGCSDLSISGVIGRNAFVDCNNINFAQANTESTENEGEPSITAQGSVKGNLNYSSSKELSIPEGSVAGETKYTKSSSQSNSFSFKNALFSLVSTIVTAIVIWLLCSWLAPKFIDKATVLLTKKTLPVIGFGILSPIVASIVAIILLILGITVPLGFLTIAILFILIAISSSISIITVAKLICAKLKMEENIKVLGIIVATCIGLWVIGLIPFIGSIVDFVVVIAGLGIVTSNLFLKNSPAEKE